MGQAQMRRQQRRMMAAELELIGAILDSDPVRQSAARDS
jgi:hypothetical protein